MSEVKVRQWNRELREDHSNVYNEERSDKPSIWTNYIAEMWMRKREKNILQNSKTIFFRTAADTLGYCKLCVQSVKKYCQKLTKPDIYIGMFCMDHFYIFFFISSQGTKCKYCMPMRSQNNTPCSGIITVHSNWKSSSKPILIGKPWQLLSETKVCAYDWFYGAWNNHHIPILLWKTF